MFLFTYIAGVLAVSFTVMAIILFLRKQGELRLLFSLYMLSAAIWMGGNAGADVASTPSTLSMFSTIALIGAMLNVVFFIILIDYLIDEKLPSAPRTVLYALPSTIIIIFSGTSLAIKDMRFPAGEVAHTIPGSLYSFALLLTLTSLIYGTVRLGKELFRQHSKDRKSRFIYVLTGLCLTTFGGILFCVLLPLMGEVRFYSLGSISCIFFAVTTGYAVTMQKLLDFNFVIQRGVIYTILAGLIVSFYFCFLYLLNLILTPQLGFTNLLTALVTTIFGIATIPTIEAYFRRVTDHIFFKDKYVYAVAMHDLCTILYTNVEFEDLVRKSEDALRRIFRATSVEILFGEFIDHHSSASNVFRIPILLDGLSIGSIYLGNKLSGGSYTREDMQLTQTFAYQAATSLSRALLYAETKRHTIELQKKVSERTLELTRAHERERQIINDISHKLQTPLAVAQTRLDKLKPSLSGNHALDSLEQSLAEISGFIYDLLSLARLESNANVPELASLNISSLVSELVEEVSIIASKYRIEVNASIEAGLHVLGDSQQLREAFMSLVSNSIKYIGSGNTNTITVLLERKGDFSSLVIEDNGMGIPEKDVPFIFDRFYRGENALRQFSGTGIGLSIVEYIVRRHFGTIKVSSVLSEGTRIELRIPIYLKDSRS